MGLTGYIEPVLTTFRNVEDDRPQMSAKWSKCVQTTITGKTSEQLQEMKAKSSNDQEMEQK